MPTKQELLEQAQALGLDFGEGNTKAEIEDAVNAHLAAAPVEAETATASKTCANCGEPAVVTLGGDVADEVSFCHRHLPRNVVL